MALRADLRDPDDPFDEQRIAGAGTAVTEQPLARGCMDRRGRRFDLLQKRSWQLPEHRVNAKESARALSDSTGTSLAEKTRTRWRAVESTGVPLASASIVGAIYVPRPPA